MTSVLLMTDNLRFVFELFPKPFLLLLFLTLPYYHGYSQKVVYFPFDESTGSVSTKEYISMSDFGVQNNFNRPERITGVQGAALRFDGWSTWIEKDNFPISGIDKSLTIECWYATESFTAANSAIVSQENSFSGLTLEVEPFGKLVFIFWADNTRYVLVTDNTLEKYQWNHIVATVDLDAKLARLFVNGSLWKEASLGIHTAISLSSSRFYIGRDTEWQEAAGFPLTMMNGALDELSIYSVALTTDQVVANYDIHASAVVDLTIDPEYRHEGDHLRPKYHAMPNTSWTNESYGLTFYNGTYHLFFQKNPNGPYLYFMHWGHLTSADLVSWKEEKIALAPSPGFDKFGVWSGTTIKNAEGKPVIVYTGVDGVKAGMGIAEAKDDELLDWEEYITNPVIASAPTDIKHMDFRDPYVWKYGDFYYMIIGSGIQNGAGGYLFTYKSNDLKTWSRTQVLYNDVNALRSGYFWEMPFFYQLNDKDWLLCVTPTPSNGVRAKAIYWIGSFNGSKFTPYDLNPKSFELISDNFLSPSIGTDEMNRIIYMGIIPEERNVNAQIKSGWRHLFSLPRQIRLLKDSTIGHIPHPNLCRLRESNLNIKDRVITPETKFNLPEVSGNQMELKFEIKADSAAKFSIHLFKNQNESELTQLHFDLEDNLIYLDRSKSTLADAAKDIREVKYVFDYKAPITVNAFLDHSVLEVFVDNTVVFSSRVYPSKEASQQVDIISTEKNIRIISLDAWSMKAMTLSNTATVCEIDAATLPIALRKENSEIVTNVERDKEKNNFEIFPNPSSDRIQLRYTGTQNFVRAHISIYNDTGVLIEERIFSQSESFPEIENLPSGVYYVVLEGINFRRTFKVIFAK